MMFRNQVKLQIEHELASGEAARQEGMEGRARVCARRAAGIAIREFYRLSGQELQNVSAYDLIQDLLHDPGMTHPIRSTARQLLEKVAEDFTLPPGVDLLANARRLVIELERLCEQNCS